jgi:hypothetical protein
MAQLFISNTDGVGDFESLGVSVHSNRDGEIVLNLDSEEYAEGNPNPGNFVILSLIEAKRLVENIESEIKENLVELQQAYGK